MDSLRDTVRNLRLMANNEGHAVEETAAVASTSELDGQAIDMSRPANSGLFKKLDVQSWLPLASPEYEISADMRDYIVTPVIIVPTDLPNRNSVAFPYEELLKFNTRLGMPNYKSWTGKPTFEEHANHNPRAAKGIIFDTYMKPINGTRGTLHKLIALCGFDRTKDPELARAIERGQRQSYSMGAFVSQYQCSICGDCSRPGKLNTECGHVVRGRPEMHKLRNGKVRPSYLMARHGIEGIEVSSVATPAWVSAVNSQFFNMAGF